MAAEFTEASVATDEALRALVKAFRARAEIGGRLQELLPTKETKLEFNHKLCSTWWAASAAIKAGLSDFMVLGRIDAHHQLSLAEQGYPEVRQAIAALRGDGSRLEAA